MQRQNEIGWLRFMAVAAWLLPLPVSCQRSIADAMRGTGTEAEIETSAVPPATVEDALHSMLRRSSTVFAGEVIEIERGTDAVVVRFRVDDGVRGVSTGSTYALREWSGLWMDDPSRYVVGQRRWMFLHGTSVAGYGSPVDGDTGAVPLRGSGVQSSVDLRWIATAVQVAPQATEQMRARSLSLLAATADSGDASATEPATTENSDSLASTDGALVSDLLHAWQRTESVP